MNLPHLLVTCQAYAAACEQKPGFIEEQATLIRTQPWTLERCLPFMYASYTQSRYEYFYLIQEMQHTIEQQLLSEITSSYAEQEECRALFDELLFPTADIAALDFYSTLPLPLYVDVLVALHERSQVVFERHLYKLALGKIALSAEQTTLAQQLFITAWLDICMTNCQKQLEPTLSFDWILAYNVFDEACLAQLVAPLSFRRTFPTDFEYGLHAFLHEPIVNFDVAASCLSLFSVYYPELILYNHELTQIEQRFLQQHAATESQQEQHTDFTGLQRLIRLYSEADYETLLPLAQQMAEQQHVFALSLLGKMYFKGLGVERDLQQSLYFFKEAYALGDDDAAMALADVAKSLKEQQDDSIVDELYPYILENTTQDSITSCLIFGKWAALHGEPFSRKQAILLLEHAFLHGLQFEKMHAAFLLATIYQHANDTRADDWYTIAKQYGLEQARHLLD